MLLSVVVPTCHRNDLLARCLDALAPVVAMGVNESTKAEVVVTDDGSRSTAEALVAERYPWARWVAGPRRGPASNRNHGARQARGEWAIFVDDDCIPDPGFLPAYADAIASDPACNVFEGRTYVDRPRRTLAESAPINETGGCLWSCNFAIRRTLFESMGGFDECFPHAAMEDVEFRLRLKQRSEAFRFVRDAAVCHPWRPVAGAKASAEYEKSLLLYLQLHPEETAAFNAAAVLGNTARMLVRSTLPGILRYRSAGLGEALRDHLFQCRLAWRLATRRPIP